MGEVLGKLGCDLDGRFSSTRTAESNLGNLMTDIMMGALNADCALLNAGTLRSNIKHPAGEFRLRVSQTEINRSLYKIDDMHTILYYTIHLLGVILI